MDSALSDHYIAFVRDDARWLDFDDTKVRVLGEAEVFEVSHGKLLPDETAAHSSGHILFYKRLHDIACERPGADITHIQELNQKVNEHKLFCSRGYFKLMRNLEDQKNGDSNDIVMPCTVDSLMFSKLSKGVKQFFKAIRTKALIAANDDFIEYFQSFVSAFIFTCQAVQLRASILKIVRVVLRNSNSGATGSDCPAIRARGSDADGRQPVLQAAALLHKRLPCQG
jgi:hypothetical protein